MMIMTLGLILLGSFSTATLMMLQGASWGMIALGYVAGGWAALLTGMLMFAILRLVQNSLDVPFMTSAKD